MELDIMELMSAYADDEFEPFMDSKQNTAHIASLVTRKLHRRRRVRILFLAAAIVLLCAACAVVARTLSYGQFDPAVELRDESGEEIAGWLRHAEWNDGRLIAEIEYNSAVPDIDEFEEYLAWINRFNPLLANISIVFASGEELSLCYHDGRWRGNIYMVSVDLPPKFEGDQPVALCVGEEEYPLAPMD